MEFCKTADLFINVIANLLAITVGVYAIFNRKKIGAFAKLLNQVLSSERIRKVKSTLSKLEAVSYDNKASRKDIIANFGELAGMIKQFDKINPEYGVCHAQLLDIIEGRKQPSEALKRKIVQEIHSLLDHQSDQSTVTLLN